MIVTPVWARPAIETRHVKRARRIQELDNRLRSVPTWSRPGNRYRGAVFLVDQRGWIEEWERRQATWDAMAYIVGRYSQALDAMAATMQPVSRALAAIFKEMLK